jgi:zinc transport system substrate-binding protein
MDNQVKKSYRWSVVAIALCLGAVFQGCTQSPAPKTKEKLDITVSILPQKYFVERIGGENVNVNVMVQPGESPHTYEPKPQQLRSLAEAEAYLSIGVSFEKAWMDRFKAANPKMPIIDTTEGMKLLPMVAHHHHGEGEHEHDRDETDETDETGNKGEEKVKENFDPHVWLSPQRVKIQAQTIYQTLVELDPENQAQYRAALDQFLADIEQLDAEIRQSFAGIQQRKFMVFHPSWGYLADDYGLEMISIEVGGQEPSAAELAQLIRQAKEENIKVIFVQPEFSTKSAETIAQEINGEVILINPLMSNWLEEMQRVTQKFAQVLRENSAVDMPLIMAKSKLFVSDELALR